MRLLLICLALTSVQASGQLLLKIDDAQPVTISAEAFSRLPRHTAEANDHGKHATYEGVYLRDLFSSNGLDLSKGLHGKQLAATVTVIASDGYRIAFGLADFDPTITEADTIIADKRDGQPLSPAEGPFRSVSPRDKRMARSAKMVREIEVNHFAN